MCYKVNDFVGMVFLFDYSIPEHYFLYIQHADDTAVMSPNYDVNFDVNNLVNT